MEYFLFFLPLIFFLFGSGGSGGPADVGHLTNSDSLLSPACISSPSVPGGFGQGLLDVTASPKICTFTDTNGDSTSIDSTNSFLTTAAQLNLTFSQPDGVSISSQQPTDVSTDIPEPGTVFGLLSLGGLGLVSKLRKQK